VTTMTPVRVVGRRGGPDVADARTDRWWVPMLVTVSILTAFVVYSTWLPFVNKDYFAGATFHATCSRLLLPCLTGPARRAAIPGRSFVVDDLPGIAYLDLPARFPSTCYYYRRTY